VLDTTETGLAIPIVIAGGLAVTEVLSAKLKESVGAIAAAEAGIPFWNVNTAWVLVLVAELEKTPLYEPEAWALSGKFTPVKVIVLSDKAASVYLMSSV